MTDHTCETGDAFRERMRLRDLATEERLAWDRYAAAFITSASDDGTNEYDDEIKLRFSEQAADFADALLEERRKRFGGPK